VYEQEQDNPWFLNMYGLALMNTGAADKAVEMLTHAVALSSTIQPEYWAAVYPGNSPADWQEGTEEFSQALKLNLELAKKKAAEQVITR
jgi:hypothetical protein